MPCPICGMDVEVPQLETRESTCTYCRVAGRDGRYKAAYYPLNHILIDHLKDIDPERDGPHRVKQRLTARRIQRESRKLKDELDEADAQVIDHKNQLSDTGMVGYGSHKSARQYF